MKKVKLIYNSVAGQSKFKYFLDTIIEKFMQNGIEVSVFRAGKKTNLYEYLKDADEGVYIPDLVSRKKQMLPALLEVLQKRV